MHGRKDGWNQLRMKHVVHTLRLSTDEGIGSRHTATLRQLGVLLLSMTPSFPPKKRILKIESIFCHLAVLQKTHFKCFSDTRGSLVAPRLSTCLIFFHLCDYNKQTLRYFDKTWVKFSLCWQRRSLKSLKKKNLLISWVNSSYKEVMLSPVSICLLVGLSIGLHKNYYTDFHETWMEDVSRPRIDPDKGKDPRALAGICSTDCFSCFLMFIFDYSHLYCFTDTVWCSTEVYHTVICPSACPTHDISRTLWGNFFKFGTNWLIRFLFS